MDKSKKLIIVIILLIIIIGGVSSVSYTHLIKKRMPYALPAS